MATSLEIMEVGDRLAVMVEALTPFLVKHVKCLHLLNYLPFLRDQAAKIRKLDRSGDHIGASELFLDCLKESDEPGRYASFRDALKEANYDHIARVLDGGNIEENHLEHCKLIEVFAEPIIEKMDPIVMLQQLRQHELITPSEEDEIRNVHREHSRYDAAMTLLDCVHRRKLGWYDKFMTTMLEIYPQLVELVDPYFKEKKERQRAVGEDLNLEQEFGDVSENDLSRQSSFISDVGLTPEGQTSTSIDGRHHPIENQQKPVSGRKRKDIPECDIKHCVHCAMLTNTVTELQTQISDMRAEIHSLKELLKKKLHVDYERK